MKLKRMNNQSNSSESINYSFLTNNYQKGVNPSDLKSIKIQADIILKNIENQIEKCQSIKQRTQQQQNNENNRLLINTRPTTGPRFHKTLPRPMTATPQNIPATKKRLDLNELCNQDVPIGNFKLETIIGQGSYATVRLATDKHSKEKYAIKIYEKSKLNDQQKMNNVKREISLLKRIEHPNIIKLCWAIEDKRQINLVMEYISSTSLAQYVKSKPNRQLTQKEALHIFYQLAKAIKYLHDKNIAHRDIKLENILLMKNNFVKLIDFGFSICVGEQQKLNVFCGTPSYMSPEIVSKTPHTPKSSDMWSLGILLSKIITGEYPFKGANDRDLYRSIQCAKWRTSLKMDDEIQRVIKGCLEKNTIQRWTIDQVIMDPVFHQEQNVNINIYAN